MRKKGLLRNNEKLVKLSRQGVLTYYDFDKPDTIKGTIDLNSHNVTSIRFEYAGKPPAAPKSAAASEGTKHSPPDAKRQRPKPNADDNFRIYV